MDLPRKPPANNMIGGNKRDSSNMASQRKDNSDSRGGRSQNGSRSGFRTDTAISSNRAGAERTLKRWVPDAGGDLDGALESSSSTGKWDQFAENERLFGLTTDYNENFYTTAIDRSHPKYNERLAAAERAARDIEKSAPVTAHVAEERVMDFAGGNDQGGDEEDKYSGVRRQQKDFPPLAPARDNKYTPPARRAPVAHSAVKGVPVDPAIISSQIKGGPGKRHPTPQPEESKTVALKAARPSSTTPAPSAKETEHKADGKLAGTKEVVEAIRPAASERSSSKPATPGNSGTSSSLRAVAASSRASLSPGAKMPVSTSSPSEARGSTPQNATENVENALLKDFKDFATQQRLHAEKARHSKMKADAQVKIQELKKFATSFKLTTPVPSDLIPIITKDPAKQKRIQEKALQNAEELAKSKTETPKAKTPPTGPGGATKPPSSVPATGSMPTLSTTATKTATSTPPAESVPFPPGGSGPNPTSESSKPSSANARPQGPAHIAHNTHNAAQHNAHSASPSGVPNRHPNARGQYMQGGYRPPSQAYRGDRSGPQHTPQGHNTGNLAERIRNSDQNRYNKSGPSHGQPHFVPPGDSRPPPTGPANTLEPNYARRPPTLPTGTPPGVPHLGPKLNPTTLEFRPSPFAVSFNPTGPSAGSSPRSTVNHLTPELSGTMASTAPSVTSVAPTITSAPSPRPASFTPIRRKGTAINPNKCLIFSHIKTLKPPIESRNWSDNDGLRPTFDTPLLWRQLSPEEEKQKPDSTMLLTYKAFFERLAFAASALATPLPNHAVPQGMPQMPHQQLPMHLQHMGHVGPRPSPHMPALPVHTGSGGPHGHVPHMPFNGNDDHRMMHSNSAQSYSSPHLGHLPMYSQPPGPAQVGFNPPVMQPFLPGTPQANQFRSFSNNPQPYMTPQPGQMMPMVPQHFVPVPGGIQQMPMYPGGPQYMAPPGATGPGTGGGPPQSIGGSSGYPSPGRPVAAPMMVQQGSQPGQSVYGMSPSMQYQQPTFGPQHPGQGGPMRGGYNNSGPHQFGTSPQNGHQFGPPHRNGGGHYGGKHYHNNHGHNNSHQGPPPHQSGHNTPSSASHHGRPAGGDGGAEEAK